MSFCTIICEYNPLHYGHIYHISQTLKATNADGLICVMSGNFTQRGECAVADKYTRAKWAVLSGADLVLELPFPFATAPAENFAYGAVRLVSSISSVKYLSFGSETGNMEKLKEMSIRLKKTDIKNSLDNGKSYASAFSENTDYKSNNILAVEYLSALYKFGSTIIPFTVKRQGADYNSTECEGLCSAGAIRNMLAENNIAACEKLPAYVYEDVKAYSSCKEKLFYMLTGKILQDGCEALEKYAYITEGLHRRIYKAALNSFDYDTLLQSIATKRYPVSKINRILLNILMGVQKDSLERAKKEPPYARVLAVKRGREDIISNISKDIKVLTRADDYKDYSSVSLKADILATDIYAKLCKNAALNDMRVGLCKY